jgi:hypothetical protein
VLRESTQQHAGSPLPHKRSAPDPEPESWPVSPETHQYAQPYLLVAQRGALPWYDACGANADGEGYTLAY